MYFLLYLYFAGRDISPKRNVVETHQILRLGWNGSEEVGIILLVFDELLDI